MTNSTQEQLELGNIIFRHAAEGIAITDPQSRILAVNQAFTALTGYSQEEVVGQTPAMLRSGRHTSEFYKRMWNALNEQGCWQGEIWNRRKSGEIFPEWLSISAVRDGEGQPLYYVGVFTDITQIMSEQAQLRELAYYDPLTRLPNRILFRDRFDQVARRALRDMRQLAMLMVDVSTGTGEIDDEFIAAVAALLTSELRETDTLARVGENEFLILIEGIDGPRSASITANHLLKALERPMQIGQRGAIYPSACIGISLYPMDGHSMDALMTAADTAMLQARSRGRHAYSFYSAEMTAYANERSALEKRLRVAIANGTLALVFQPIFDADGVEVLGAEALVRWTDPDLGVVGPDRFVPVAEDCGLIHALGEWVMREAFRSYMGWQADGIAPGVLSINISARQLDRADFVDSVSALLAETGMDPKHLEFEFRESVLSDVAYVVSALEALEQMGIRLSIDGFGTGISPLSNLQTLPVCKLNIDRSFVRAIGVDSANETIVRAVVSVAQALGLRVVAEGVETEDQASFLRARGCDEFQGYLLGRAVSGDDFARYFGQRKSA